MLLLVTGAFAQQGTEMKTLFGNSGIRSNGGYGALTTGYSNIDNRDAILMGARGAWLPARQLSSRLCRPFNTSFQYNTVRAVKPNRS